MGEFSLFDLRVIVERIEGRSVCGLQPGDYFEVTESSHIRIPGDRHFCIYALSAILPLLPAVQRRLADDDWLEQDTLVACPDPDERVLMRIERIGCGVVVPPGRPELLARAIRDAHDGKYDLTEMGRLGREWVEHEADRTVAIGRYRELLRELAPA